MRFERLENGQSVISVVGSEPQFPLPFVSWERSRIARTTQLTFEHIMIFRRFSRHVREQTWFAVGIDLLVVVIGIFLGFQLDGWNEDRKERGADIEPQMPALLLYQYIEFLKKPLRKHGVEIDNPIPRPDSDGKHVF